MPPENGSSAEGQDEGEASKALSVGTNLRGHKTLSNQDTDYFKAVFLKSKRMQKTYSGHNT